MWSRKWHNLPHQTVMSSTTDMMDKQKWANASAFRKRSNGSLCSSKWPETWLLSLELVLPPLTRQIWPSDFFSKGYLIVWCDLTKGVMRDSMNISRSLLYRILNSNLQILDRCPGDRCQLISSSLNGHAWNSGGYFFAVDVWLLTELQWLEDKTLLGDDARERHLSDNKIGWSWTILCSTSLGNVATVSLELSQRAKSWTMKGQMVE
jgi:hypothetical protein